MYYLLAPNAINRTWLVGVWCAGVLAGIGLVRAGLLLDGVEILLLGIVLLAPAFKRSRLALGLILTSGLLIGSWQGTRTEMELRSLDSYIGQRVTVKGSIAEDPVKGQRQETVFYISILELDQNQFPGKVRVSTLDDRPLQRGDVVTISGKLSPGFGNYQARLGYVDVLQIQKVDQPVLAARDAFADGVRNAVPEPEASLGLGFLLGQRSALPEELDEQLRLVGLTHIVVASGYNLTILVRAARRLLAGISKFQAFAGSMTLVSAFVAVTGFSPSMTRAAFVTTLSLLAWYYGRRIHPLVLLLFVAAITGLVNPLFAWSDLGWYLSFLAFAGVLMLAPLITARLYKDERPPLMVQVCIESIAAQIMVLPLILWLFGELPVLSLVANLLVVPLIPITMLLTFGAGLAGVFLPAVAPVVGFPATIFISYMTAITQWLSGVSWAMVEVGMGLIGTLVLYSLVFATGLILWRKTQYDFLRSAITD